MPEHKCWKVIFDQTLSPVFFIDRMGGMFVVSVNAVLQELEQQSIGSGSTVGIARFFQNLAMLLAVGGYTFAAAHNIIPYLQCLC
jgi:LPLT family lysophospholipid transporter-like MFS transporter